MADVAFLPDAEADYQGALAWYRAHSPKAATGFETAVAEAVQDVASNPELYGLLDDRHRRCPLRRHPYGLIYRVEPAGVLVVAVAHSRRTAAYWQGRTP
jgi:plasmid stabilization system protein ParE